MSAGYADLMPKNSTLDNLRRLIALDAILASTVLYVGHFAEEWGVDARTIRRDLAMLRQLGQKMRHERVDKDPHPESLMLGWGYERGVEPLFACNVRKGGRSTSK
jgi:hypothetical protein